LRFLSKNIPEELKREVLSFSIKNPDMSANRIGKHFNLPRCSVVFIIGNRIVRKSEPLNLETMEIKNGIVTFSHSLGTIKIDLLCLDYFLRFRWNVSKVSRLHVYLMKTTGGYYHREVLNNPEQLVDHKNRDTLDNTLANLRTVERWQNNVNCVKTSKLGVRGVQKIKSGGKEKYRAYVFRKTLFRSQWFETLQEAKAEYNKMSRQQHEEFAYQHEL
jgi:hypothetical protein